MKDCLLKNGVWIQLDSITQDTRNYYTNTPGRVVMEFSIGQDTSGVEYWRKKFMFFVSDTMATHTFASRFQAPLAGGQTYIMTVTGIEPQRFGDVDISQGDYTISFVLEEGLVAKKAKYFTSILSAKTKNERLIEFSAGR